MAVAAYAYVTSLLHVLDQVQHPARCRLLPNTKQIETLHEKVHFLQEFLEDHSQGERDHIKYLGRQIAEVAYEAEDIIDSHVADQLCQEYEDKTDDMGLSLLLSQSTTDMEFSCSSFCRDIDNVIENIDSIKNKVDYYVMTVGEWGGFHVGLSNTDSGQCRRTNGKKWRCSRDAVVDKKYCKRHLNGGGRNHSMQPLHSTNNTNLPRIASSMSASVVGGGGCVSRNFVSANDHLPGIPKSINRSLVDKELPKDKHTYSVVEQQPPIVSVRAGSSTLLPSCGKSTRVVGFDEQLVQIMQLLTRDRPNLQIIPIVGMGGIGKTTLARFVFENKYVVENFDKRVWLTISQEYSVHEILLCVLRDIGVDDDLKSENLAELRLRLHQELSGRRYLIVMDDLWSTNGWDDFKSSFPNYRNGSRVMVTTRLKDVANSLGSHNAYLMEFLNEDKSWNLLCEKAFSQGSCSPELEEIGKRIARSCKGLPLAIVIIGGFLAKSDMTWEYWESVARKVNLLVSSENDEDCFKILSFSYDHLPIHLKPCFLYMGFFPEDCEIEVFALIESWVDEGFLKPIRGKSLEEVANEYLKDLIERNLILIRERGRLGDITRCGVHDLLRDLCRRESLNERFLSVPKSQQTDFYVKGNDERLFLLTPGGLEIDCSKVIVGPRSIELFGPLKGDPNPHLISLCLHSVRDDRCYEKLPIYTKLRYLCLVTDTLDLLSFSTISQLWKLQTLYIAYEHGWLVLPSEIWKMPQLRHVIISKGFSLPIVTQIEKAEDFIVLENLHTLLRIYEFRCTEDVVKRIPNLKELEIVYNYRERERDMSYYCLHNIAKLHKLESLVLHDYYGSNCENIAFPYSLKKLVLEYCTILWENISVIGSLPNLEVLKLAQTGETGKTDEWNPVEDEFHQLKFLYVRSTRLRCWKAESIHFPKLEILELGDMKYLKEIPSGIGAIETLRKIELYDCSSSVINSAKEIYEEQKDFGNEDFQLFINKKRYQN